MTPNLKLNFVSEMPLYQQLAVQLKRGIEQGKFDVNSPLPSIIKISQTLSISKATPMRAYGYLAKEGLVKWEKGKGFFVAKSKAASR